MSKDKDVLDVINYQRTSAQQAAVTALSQLDKSGVDVSKLTLLNATELVSAMTGREKHEVLGLVSAVREAKVK